MARRSEAKRRKKRRPPELKPTLLASLQTESLVPVQQSWDTNNIRLLKRRLRAAETKIAALTEKASLAEVHEAAAEVYVTLIGEKDQTIKELTHIIHQDRLTGLRSKDGLLAVLESVLPRTDLDQALFTVMFIDIDNFKIFNDTYGHDYGDTVLKAVGTTLRKKFNRRYDYVCRWHGDEFVIVTIEQGTPFLDRSKMKQETVRREQRTLEREAARAHRAKEAIENLELPHGSISVSTGVSTQLGIPEANILEFLTDLLKRADEAMYRAKKSGRNSVAVSEE